ncbi:MAG: hypothetical protein HY074_15795 [Deltaproteobacteria bacterium]|nr:hypothetical protein [Deltaproteobacteria bacterium]
MKSLFVVLACLTVLTTFGALHASAADTDCKNIDPNAGVKDVKGDATKAPVPTAPASKEAAK